jgi:hypothetical protein
MNDLVKLNPFWGVKKSAIGTIACLHARGSSESRLARKTNRHSEVAVTARGRGHGSYGLA